MKPLSPLFLAGLALALCGCQTSDVTTLHTVEKFRMDRTGSVYVVTPLNGAYAGKTYEGSAAAVVSALDAAFSKYSGGVVAGPYCDTIAEALSAARSRRCAYVVVPKITRWEDQPTEVTGGRAAREVIVKVLDVADGTEIRRVSVLGKSRWMNFTGERPRDLLIDPIEEFVEDLYDR